MSWRPTTKKAAKPIARCRAALACGCQYPNRSDNDYGLSVAPLAASSVVVVVVVLSVPVPVPVVVVVVSSSPLHPATTKVAVKINIANKLLIARSPEMVSKILAPDCRGMPLNMVQRRVSV
jgi:hypothetical protein